MSCQKRVSRKSWIVLFLVVQAVIVGGFLETASARNNIRSAFFDVYPDAVGTAIETVPSAPGHCGVCHYDFSGGGTRNPYGVLL